MSEKKESGSLGEDVRNALYSVIDPELGVSVVDLGLIYGIEPDDMGGVVINMTLTTPTCPLTDTIEQQINAALSGVVTSFHVNWVWNPPWTTDFITEDGKAALAAIGFNF